MPEISVIVPVYKVEQFLHRCVESILRQSFYNFELILVDDGSPDSCGEICDAYAAGDNRIHVIHQKNGGLSAARNTGIDYVMKSSDSHWIAFVDSDDWVEPQTYEWMLTLVHKYDVRLVCAGRYDVDGDTGEKKRGLCPPREEVITGEELVRRIFRWDNIDSAACDKLYHCSLLESFRYPEGRVCEDVPVTYRIALGAEKVVMYPGLFFAMINPQKV